MAPGAVRLRALEPVSEEHAARLLELVGRRERREPLQHLFARWPFLELELRSDARALVPRPETEDLVLAARERLGTGPRRVVDIGTGTGCIALAMASSHPEARVLGVDVDEQALTLARENAALTGLAERVAFERGWLTKGLADASVDMLLANLPYVSEEEWADLEPEVRDHDPKRALVAPEEGMALLRELASDMPRPLRPGGWVLLEMASPQTEEIAALMVEQGLEDVGVWVDRYGRPRGVHARRRESVATPP